MNIGENNSMDASEALYSLGDILKAGRARMLGEEAAPLQENTTTPAPAPPPPADHPTLPKLGRYINVWA